MFSPAWMHFSFPKKKKGGLQKGSGGFQIGYQVRLGLIQAAVGLSSFYFKLVGIESFKSFVLRAILKVVGPHTPLPDVLTSRPATATCSFVWGFSWDAGCSAREQSSLPPQRCPGFPPEVAQVKVALWAQTSHPSSRAKQSHASHKKEQPCSGIGLEIFIFMWNHKYKIKIVNKCYRFLSSLGWGSGLILSTSKS